MEAWGEGRGARPHQPGRDGVAASDCCRVRALAALKACVGRAHIALEVACAVRSRRSQRRPLKGKKFTGLTRICKLTKQFD